MDLLFPNRRAAGRLLARDLAHYAGRSDLLVLALPRGGVPVGFEIAQALGVPLDVLVVRKLGLPGREELAMGAIAYGGACVINSEVFSEGADSEETFATVLERETCELYRREAEYRRNRAPLELKGRTVILVDDGLATGATMSVAIKAARHAAAAQCMVAVPVGAADACEKIRHLADALHCLAVPRMFPGVGGFYEDFSQVEDDEVRQFLEVSNLAEIGATPDSGDFRSAG